MLDPALLQTEPELARRYTRLIEIQWEKSRQAGISAATRSRALQESLRTAFLAGTYKVPDVADPNALGSWSPWGWRTRGSKHMIQADGYSHALDLWRAGSTEQEFKDDANACGLSQTVKHEWWHLQAWEGGLWFPITDPKLLGQVLTTQSVEEEEDDMTPVYKKPTVRPGTGPGTTQTLVQDFTVLPADTGGQAPWGTKISSQLYLRLVGDVPNSILVFFDAVPQQVDLPRDGSTIGVPVPRGGLCSVVGDGIVVESCEIWSKG